MSSDLSDSNEAGGREAQDPILNLDFVPTWARQPAVNPYTNARGPDEERPRGDRPGGRFRGAGPRQGGRPHGDRDRRRERGDQGDRRDRRPQGRDRHLAQRPPPRLPITLSFIPERVQLSALARQLHAAQKAFPLDYLSHLLLAKSEFHLIKIEAKGDLQLWQFKPDGAVFLDQETLRAHALRLHLSQVFDETVEQGEPPAGNFNCVGRCTLSGEWLGPPNHHGYQERLLDLQRTRFPHLTIDEYRARVEMVRDAAAVEQWKEAARTRRVYRPKGQPDAAPISREEAVLHYTQKQLGGLQQSGRRFIMPAAMVRELPDSPLRRQLEEAWTRENKKPFTMSLALRPAFKHMRLHLFKGEKGEVFVTAILPKPLDESHAVENIRAMIELIRKYPGWKRAELAEHLQPGILLDSDEAKKLLEPLSWLIEKGHVIEFFNGALSLPKERRKDEPTPVQESGTAEATTEVSVDTESTAAPVNPAEMGGADPSELPDASAP